MLAGAPGIFSARFAGPGADDAANNTKLQSVLAGVPLERRTARYRCVLAFVAGPGDPAPLTAQGVWEGVILESPRGSGGFGYDPYFWLPELNKTAAELEPEDKNERSHRGLALRSLHRLLQARELPGPHDPSAVRESVAVEVVAGEAVTRESHGSAARRQ